MFLKKIATLFILVLSTFSFQLSHAEGLDQLIEGGKISGNLRLYSFHRDYDSDNKQDQHAFALGGKIKAESGELNGFSGALAYYFANDLGVTNHDDNNKHVNPNLMGYGHSINILGEAYLQYKSDLLFARVGNQVIDTPWINSGDAVVIPNLYQGVSAAITPVDGLKIESERILRYKNRTSSSFERNTFFDLSYSNPKYFKDSDGAVALGATYKKDQISAKAWLYRFYDFADLGYLQAGYTFSQVGKFTPFVDFQYMKETGSGDEVLGSVDSQAYGAKAGVLLPEKLGSLYVAYNLVPHNNEAGISNGNLISPYTQGYVTDPLFTSGMNYGLVSARAAGHAWQIGGIIKPLGESLDIIPTISYYDTEPYVKNVQTYTLDVAYHFSGKLKGFTIRNRLGVDHGNPQWGSTYIDNRVMLSYVF